MDTTRCSFSFGYTYVPQRPRWRKCARGVPVRALRSCGGPRSETAVDREN